MRRRLPACVLAGYPAVAIRNSLLAVLIIAAATYAAASETPLSDGFQLDDYFRVNRIAELALSQDGKFLVYITQGGSVLSYFTAQRSEEEQRKTRQVFLHDTENGTTIRLERLNGARAFAWIPGRSAIAYPAPDRAGVSQVFAYDVKTRKTTQKTRAPAPVERFRFSPDGRSLAYLARRSPREEDSLYQKFRKEDRGLLIDADKLILYDFLDPNSQSDTKPARLWLGLDGGAPFSIDIPGQIEGDFFWSPDGGRISVAFCEAQVGETLDSAERRRRASLGVFDIARREFTTIAAASEGFSYVGGEWIDETRFLVRRRRHKEHHSWIVNGAPDIAALNAAAPENVDQASWHQIEISGSGSIFLPAPSGRILLQDIREGVQGLFEMEPQGFELHPALADLAGGGSLFSFSADFRKAAFVNESLTSPPEIYLWSEGEGARRVTALNADIAARIDYTARALRWTSKDGATVHGWLLGPKYGAKKPMPLLVHVHGGPGWPFPDAFAPYFELWPYPLELLAAHGVAVLLPNYRGTHSYGRAFAWPSRPDGEPADDIVTGVERLIAQGVADPARLAISGHSHGAWLGPLVMARYKTFLAGSFAEGWSNTVTLYSVMPGWLNREVHDSIGGSGVSLLEQSPDLHFQGLTTASLFEAGAYSLAPLMMGYPKAAKRAGAPAEFVIYPQTEHNMALSHLQRESATRNLDWFRFWLQGYEDPGPEKAEQYKRWREMR